MPPAITQAFVFILAANLLFHKKITHFIGGLAVGVIATLAIARVFWALMSIGTVWGIMGWLTLIGANLLAGRSEEDENTKKRIEVITASISAFIIVTFFLFSGGFKTILLHNHLLACHSKLRNIGTALEMYSDDNKGLYPDSLAGLEPKYMKRAPTCFGKDYDKKTREIFKRMYGFNLGDYDYDVSDDHKAFTIICCGKNHDGMPTDYPRYTNKEGLIAR